MDSESKFGHVCTNVVLYLLLHSFGSERKCHSKALKTFNLSAVSVLTDMLKILTCSVYHSTTNRIRISTIYLFAAHVRHETPCPDILSPYLSCAGYESPMADGEGEPARPVEPAVATGETIPPLCG